MSAPEVKAIIVGGSSGMGKGTAITVLKQGGEALIVSRSAEKLEAAKTEIVAAVGPDSADRIKTGQLDFTDEAAVKVFFGKIPEGGIHHLDVWCPVLILGLLRPGHYNGLVVTACGRSPHGAFLELDTAMVRELFDQKFFGPYHCAKYGGPRLKDGGCVVFCSGVLCRRPGLNCSPLSSVNGAVEGLTRALALELGPRLRVNCLSPGFVDTERFDHMPAEKKQKMLESTAASLPLQRCGEKEDIGEAIHFLLSNTFTTGVTLDVDGGHQIRQYASAANDPFRKK